MVRNRKVWGVLGLLLALVVVVGYGQQPLGQQPTPAAMQQAQMQFMQQLVQLMTSAAQELKVTLPPALIPGVVYATRSGDNPILAGAPVRGLEKVTSSDLSRGAVLGVVYLQLPSRWIPAGFYKLRVVMTPTDIITPGAPNAQAQFIDKSEKVVRELPATVGTSERPTVGATWTAELGDNEACLDAHWGRFGFKACITW